MDNSSAFPFSTNFAPQAEQFLARLIRKKAGQLIGQAGFRPGDEKDIEHDINLKVARHLSAYRGDQGHLLAFLTAIVERKVASMLRDGRAQKRDARGTVSLSVQVELADEGTVELAATVTRRELDARIGRKSRDDEATSNLKQDVDAITRTLTPDERKVCEGLKYGSITQVSHELGIPRSTIYDMIGCWRAAFQSEGLQEYL